MLDTFRSSAQGVTARMLLALVCLSFVVWGIDDVARSPERNRTLARVGDSAITADQYARALRGEIENIRRMMGDSYSPEAVRDMDVEAYVLQNLINHRLLKLESASLGLIPGDIDVIHRIRGNSAFHDNKGNFDKGIFEATLRNINTTEKAYVDQLREEMAVNILLDTLSSAIPASDYAAPTLLHAREEGRQVTLYALNESGIPAVTAPGDAEIRDYYDAHPQAFTAPELRQAAYVTITARDLPASPAADEQALRAAYDERIEEYRRPERRTLEQLLYSSEAQARKAADLIRSGRSFQETAAALVPLNKGATAMGKVERGSIFENAADRVFSLSRGDISEPVQSPFGWHVFHVIAIEPPSVAAFEEVRPVLQKEWQQRHDDEALTALANRVEDALAGGSSLAEAAKEFNLKLVALPPVTAAGLDAAGKKTTLPALDRFLETLFKTEEKTESPVMTSRGGTYYILRVESLTPERLRPLEEVKSEIVKAWQQQERARLLADRAAQMGKEFAGGGAARAAKFRLQQVGRSIIRRSSHTAGDISLPPSLVQDIFSRSLHEGTAAHRAGDGTYLLAVADSIVPAGSPDRDPRLAASLAEVKRNLHSVKQNEIMEEYTAYLRGRYPVKIHDDVFRSVTR